MAEADFRLAAPPRRDARPGRTSAVLVLLGEPPAGTGDRVTVPGHEHGGPDLVMIERAASLRNHAGQCAFPGGGTEEGDGGPVGTALREAAEEIGLRPDTVEVVAVLPELWLAVSNFLVTPVLAWWREPHPVSALDPVEVARVARLPIAELAHPDNRFRVRHSSGFVGPAFRVRDMLIWGFTGGVVDRLLDLAGWSVPWDTSRVEPLPAGA
ncbi:MAG: CoA pyrophosphatase [Actinocatenispora sp.]